MRIIAFAHGFARARCDVATQAGQATTVEGAALVGRVRCGATCTRLWGRSAHQLV